MSTPLPAYQTKLNLTFYNTNSRSNLAGQNLIKQFPEIFYESMEKQIQCYLLMNELNSLNISIPCLAKITSHYAEHLYLQQNNIPEELNGNPFQGLDNPIISSILISNICWDPSNTTLLDATSTSACPT